MNLLHSYNNGNTTVELYSDGTRIRTYEGKPQVGLPDSCDVKITDYCYPTKDNPICAYCHERSNLSGKHADLDVLFSVLKDLPKGSECAIGGGAPLSHPNIIPFLQKLKSIGIVSNITINQKHLELDKDLTLSLIRDNLIYGIGISYSSAKYLSHIKPILESTDNLVFHLIMGLNKLSDINELNSFCLENNKKCKVLILGYKNYGLGINYYLKNPNIEDNKYKWYTQLGRHFKNDNLILSFDNLAISQMKLKRYFTNEAWDTFFQGEDGTHSMYIDGVKQEFAKSSTSYDRVSFSETNLKDFFKKMVGNNEF